MGCPCHIIHNTAHKGSVGFTRATKFDIKDFFELSYTFTLSTQQKNALQSYEKILCKSIKMF